MNKTSGQLRTGYLLCHNVESGAATLFVQYSYKWAEAGAGAGLQGLGLENGVHMVPGENKNGTACKIPSIKPSERNNREQRFLIACQRLFNCLSKKLRNVTNYKLNDFKDQIDKFLTFLDKFLPLDVVGPVDNRPSTW